MPFIQDISARAAPSGGAVVPTTARQGDLGPAVIIVGAVALVLTTVAFTLRIVARIRSSRLMDLWWDDWALLATTVSSHAFLALNMAWTGMGLGKHIENINLTSILPTLYMSKASIQLYSLCIWLIKVSALLCYARLFKISRKFRMALWFFAFWVTAWFLCTAIVPWFNCTPVRKTLDPTIPGVCPDRMGWFKASAFINTISDMSILILPMPCIWALKMTLRTKIQVTFVFLLGYSSAFLSLARFVIIIHDPTVMSVTMEADPYYHTIPLLLISMLEAPLAIIALCAPTIGQSWARIYRTRNFSSFFSSMFKSKSSENTYGSQPTYKSESNSDRTSNSTSEINAANSLQRSSTSHDQKNKSHTSYALQ